MQYLILQFPVYYVRSFRSARVDYVAEFQNNFHRWDLTLRQLQNHVTTFLNSKLSSLMSSFKQIDSIF